MKRKELLKKFISLLPKDELVIFIGKQLCEEAYLNDKENYLYLLDNYSISFAVGMASVLPANTRVYVIFEDTTLLEDVGALFQVFLNSNVNLFLVFIYNKDGFFKTVSHIQGVFFNIGIQSFSISNYFLSAEKLKSLKQFLVEMKGPKIYLVEAENSKINKPPEMDKNPIFFRDRFNFIVNKLIGATTNDL